MSNIFVLKMKIDENKNISKQIIQQVGLLFKYKILKNSAHVVPELIKLCSPMIKIQNYTPELLLHLFDINKRRNENIEKIIKQNLKELVFNVEVLDNSFHLKDLRTFQIVKLKRNIILFYNVTLIHVMRKILKFF